MVQVAWASLQEDGGISRVMFCKYRVALLILRHPGEPCGGDQCSQASRTFAHDFA